MAPWGIGFLNSQLFARIPYPTEDFTTQTVIVTGSNTGLGFEAARHFVRLGASKVILAVRTIAKGEAAAKRIIESCKVPGERVEVWQLDMSDVESIKAFAKKAEGLERLDAAVLNAGIMSFKYSTTKTGMESHLAINVIGTLLLATLLLPTLKSSAKRTGLRSRLTVVGSDTMDLVSLSTLNPPSTTTLLSYLNDPSNCPGMSRYQISKLLVNYTIHNLAQQHPVKDSGVLLTDLTPGFCKSEIFRDEDPRSAANKFVMDDVIMPVIARTTEVDARTLVHGVSPGLPDEAHGRFLRDCKVWPEHENLTSEEGKQVAAKWNAEVFAQLENLAPGCTKVQ